MRLQGVLHRKEGARSLAAGARVGPLKLAGVDAVRDLVRIAAREAGFPKDDLIRDAADGPHVHLRAQAAATCNSLERSTATESAEPRKRAGSREAERWGARRAIFGTNAMQYEHKGNAASHHEQKMRHGAARATVRERFPAFSS